MPMWISLSGQTEMGEAACAGLLLLNSLGCIRKTNLVRVVMGVMDGHQQSDFGQKQR